MAHGTTITTCSLRTHFCHLLVTCQETPTCSMLLPTKWYQPQVSAISSQVQPLNEAGLLLGNIWSTLRRPFSCRNGFHLLAKHTLHFLPLQYFARPVFCVSFSRPRSVALCQSVS
ncbi:hypothetical protein V5799_013708 [Amblyomma americanum]|uniref:Uncharacterized protein n=1 Tax=Amblyomma americanum TaxID=6943 RepID=A0AAQ4E557_AMBAM